MADHIRIEQASGTWVVRDAESVLGESTRALVLREGDYPPVIYFPRADIAMDFLDITPKSTHCPWKGDASYYTIAAKSGAIENAAWSYEDPKDEVAAIKGHLAFYSDDITVEKL